MPNHYQPEHHISDKVREACGQLKDQALAQTVFTLFSEQRFNAYLPHFAVRHLCDKFNLTARELSLALLPVASAYAHTPISKFNVGAIAIGESGAFYFGANLEFKASCIQQTVHAEQSAIAHAWIRGETALREISVNYAPCGHCRQFMNELNKADGLVINLPENPNNALKTFLPHSFGPNDLDINERLLLPRDNGYLLLCEDPLHEAALAGLNISHAPYSGAFAGAALETEDSFYFWGSYAENAAFNPSLNALQVAINHLILSGFELQNIKRAVLIEKKSPLSQKVMAQQLLATLCKLPLEFVSLE
ncbi:cytidine deaminase [Pasteurellaceae bacterium 20609_3]|uniref:cytidine deaminase n=1 Tax=Spirabiliibacterium mucosae TaxID=28156 RepID=UPI001AAD5BF4|nr:cytidine deaminase [Spirabiliibacterium mucosae]MBE2898210.1 cytidine deaminase [Spirabiliibacterium mucosae]